MAELADALRSGRSELWAHEGSNPSFGTYPPIERGICVKHRKKTANGTICVIKRFSSFTNDAELSEMKKILKDKRIIVVIAVVILVLLFLNFNQRMVLLAKLRGQQKELEQEYMLLEATRAALQTEIAYAQSDQAVEEWAREEAGMIQAGDIPIVLLPPSESVPTKTNQPDPIAEEVGKWEIWWELFFGE